MGKRKPTEARKTRPAAASKPGKLKASDKKPAKPVKAGAARSAPPAPTRRPAATKAVKPNSKRKSASAEAGSPPGNNGRSAREEDSMELRTTHLNSAELEEFRQLLVEKRCELIGDVNHLQNEAMRQGSSGESSGASSMPIHMADIGTDTWEQELTLGLIENERGLLREIDEALKRIDDRTYGICMATNRPISKSRLRAKPWAKYCIEYARKRELGLA